MEAKGVQGARVEIHPSVMPGKTQVDLFANLRRNIWQEMEMAGTIIPNRKLTEKWALQGMIADQMNGARVASQMYESQKNNESLRVMHPEIVLHQILLCAMLDLREMLLKRMDGVLRKVDGAMLNQNLHVKCGLKTKEMIESLPLIIEKRQHMVGMEEMEEMPQPTEEMHQIADRHSKGPRKVGGTTITQEIPYGTPKVKNGEKAAS
mmetsp:Transcript_2413/g.5046  ORF Transcript_2413/g.5046 Transcript_2413/m.5046 type:complete len:207 (-) Transcript_2413:471-1091(-)